MCTSALVQDDEKLPDKVTDVYYNLIKCLIRRERSTRGNGIIAKESPNIDYPAIICNTHKNTQIFLKMFTNFNITSKVIAFSHKK
jgi:hypothetical protein